MIRPHPRQIHLWPLTLEFARRVDVPVVTVPARLHRGEWHEAPGGNCGILSDLRSVAVVEGAGCGWEVLLHEVSHVVWMHPEHPLRDEQESTMIVYEAAVCAAIGGPRMRVAYMRSSYVRGTAIGDEGRVEVDEWKRPLATGWARRGRREGLARGVLDADGRPTWRRAVWA